MKQTELDSMAGEMFEKQCWVIDFLPKQVPEKSGSNYFSVERYYMSGPGIEALYAKFTAVLIKLSCYYDMAFDSGNGWVEAPEPEMLTATIKEHTKRGYVNFLFPAAEALVALNGGDLYMSLYNPPAEMLDILVPIAFSEGLFVREAAVI